MVQAESRLIEGKLAAQYCGRLRDFDQDCSNATYQCTYGPMFDIEARQSVDVIWVNNLDMNQRIPAADLKDNCMNQKFEPHKGYCDLKSKTHATMTFDDPTMHPQTNSPSFRISTKAWPISTHVHGA
jgi:hypothetical protein